MPDETTVVEDVVTDVAESTPVDMEPISPEPSEDTGDTPAIPKDRFDEVNSRMKAAEEELAALKGASDGDLLAARNLGTKPTDLPGTDVAKHVQQLEDRLALNELKSQHDDVSKYAKAMAELVQKNPTIDWEVAYKSAKYDDLAKNAKQEGRAEAYQNIAQKTAAQSESPQAKRTAQIKNVDAMIADKGTSLADIEKLLPKS